MKGAVLIFGSNKIVRRNRVEEYLYDLDLFDKSKAPDILKIELGEEKSLGIAVSREITNFLTTKPFNGMNKAVVVFEAHKLTTQAQNALLKSLEEPQDYASIFLCTNAENELLDTVTSRCLRINLTTISYAEENIDDVENIFDKDIEYKMEWAEKTSKLDKAEMIDLLAQYIIQARHKGEYNNIPLILKLKNDFESTNLNIKLGLEWLALHLQ